MEVYDLRGYLVTELPYYKGIPLFGGVEGSLIFVNPHMIQASAAFQPH